MAHLAYDNTSKQVSLMPGGWFDVEWQPLNLASKDLVPISFVLLSTTTEHEDSRMTKLPALACCIHLLSPCNGVASALLPSTLHVPCHTVIW
jgi:hypothetical protein